MASSKLVFNENTPKEQYDELYKLPEGSIFKVEADYETVMMRIEEYKPEGHTFEVFPINPGTDQYTLVGPNHCMVTVNTLLQ